MATKIFGLGGTQHLYEVAVLTRIKYSARGSVFRQLFYNDNAKLAVRLPACVCELHQVCTTLAKTNSEGTVGLKDDGVKPEGCL